MHDPRNFARLQQLYAEGEAAIQARRFDEAIAKFSEGLQIDDQFRQRYVTMYAQRAFAFHNLGRFAEAEADYARAIPMEPPPHAAQNHFQRGMCLRQLGRDVEALDAFTQAIAIMPEQPGPRHLRGKLFVDRDRWMDAIADFDAFLASGNTHPEVFQLRALAHLCTQNASAALDDASSAQRLRQDPYNDYIATCAFAHLGNFDAMLGAMTRTLQGEPGFKDSFRQATELAPYRGDPRVAALLA
jgi:tetratricopeptide (TPR) repeat protein